MFFAGFFMLLFTLLGIFLGKDPSGDRSMSLMFYISMYGEALMVCSRIDIIVTPPADGIIDM